MRGGLFALAGEPVAAARYMQMAHALGQCIACRGTHFIKQCKAEGGPGAPPHWKEMETEIERLRRENADLKREKKVEEFEGRITTLEARLAQQRQSNDELHRMLDKSHKRYDELVAELDQVQAKLKSERERARALQHELATTLPRAGEEDAEAEGPRQAEAEAEGARLPEAEGEEAGAKEHRAPASRATVGQMKARKTAAETAARRAKAVLQAAGSGQGRHQHHADLRTPWV